VPLPVGEVAESGSEVQEALEEREEEGLRRSGMSFSSPLQEYWVRIPPDIETAPQLPLYCCKIPSTQYMTSPTYSYRCTFVPSSRSASH